jgi:hypothetical protein
MTKRHEQLRLNKDEIDAIKEHEHIPEIAAAAWQTIY